MQFSEQHKVKIESMTRDEAKVFIIFLETEILRHQEDIVEAEKLTKKVKDMYRL